MYFMIEILDDTEKGQKIVTINSVLDLNALVLKI